jgi:valyl-tRNA synthetase
VWEWKRRSGGRIYEQLKVMGASLDWSRAKFTMDPELSVAVREAFVRLYEQGLIYRANRMVNWSIKAAPCISDLEVDREEPEAGKHNSELFAFAYLLERRQRRDRGRHHAPRDHAGRPAIAVHPDDPRYRDVIGKTVRHPFVDREFPVIADAVLADPTKGTGAVKVTPAHDFNDFECGKRHNLGDDQHPQPRRHPQRRGRALRGHRPLRRPRGIVKAALAEKGLARGSKPHKHPLRPLPARAGHPRAHALAAVVRPGGAARGARR